MSNKRVEILDMLKGLGILLMVIGHLEYGDTLNQYIYSFHMPLFYIVSGYLFKQGPSLVSDINKNFVRSFRPYIISVLVFSSAFILYQHNLNYKIELLHFFMPNHYPYDWCGPIWFLMSIFVVKSLFALIHRFNNGRVLLTSCLTLGCLGFYFGYEGIKLPFTIDSSLIGIFLFYLGYALRSAIVPQKLCDFFMQKKYILLSLLLFPIVFINCKVNMRTADIGNPLFFTIGVVANVYIAGFVLSVLLRFERLKKILFYYSNNSIFYLCTNQFIIALSTVALSILFSRLHLCNILILEVIRTFVVLALLSITCLVIDACKSSNFYQKLNQLLFRS